MPQIIWWIDSIARETMLFAAVGLFIGGVDDFLVDLVFLARRAWRRGIPALTLATIPVPARPGRIAVFVAAWDEGAVIGGMLAAALARFDHPDYRIFVGLYPNDPGSIDAAAAIAERDDRIRIVIGTDDGPTTKAACLNTVWRALIEDDRRAGLSTRAIVLHDAEDVVHPNELTVFDALIEGRAVVQLPVLPLVKRGSALVSGHYADEFAEAHAKQMVVRTALGAGMPLAGTGCAIAPAMLAAIAGERGGDPFDAASLTEDYELGLRIAERGGPGIFARVAEYPGGPIVAVRAYFPATMKAAVRQKARWMTGIALAGWDRTGWARPLAIGDHWMRMRDRRAPLSVVVLATAYVALLLWGLSGSVHWLVDIPYPFVPGAGGWLLIANALLLVWRLAMRMAFTRRTYGWSEGLLSVPRFMVSNLVSLLAAPRAVVRYVRMLRGMPTVWDKTRHEFPDLGATGTF